MKEKVILVSIDGMRPDGFLACGNPFAEKMMQLASYSLQGKTVFPSVTLPCHTSMFHSVPPERHGITTNLYIPFARPLNGLFEQICIWLNMGSICRCLLRLWVLRRRLRSVFHYRWLQAWNISGAMLPVPNP